MEFLFSSAHKNITEKKYIYIHIQYWICFSKCNLYLAGIFVDVFSLINHFWPIHPKMCQGIELLLFSIMPGYGQAESSLSGKGASSESMQSISNGIWAWFDCAVPYQISMNSHHLSINNTSMTMGQSYAEDQWSNRKRIYVKWSSSKAQQCTAKHDQDVWFLGCITN